MRKSTDRNKLIQLIHVAKRDLKLEDDIYRSILQRIGGMSSTLEMTVPNLMLVLQHMKDSGFKVRTTKPAKAKQSRPLAQDAESKKIRALWLFLHEIGIVKNPSEAALASYVKRMTGVEALQWINGDQAALLIEAQKKWAMRKLPDVVKGLVEEVRKLPLSDMDRGALNYALSKAFERNTFDPMHYAWECLTDVLRRASQTVEGGHHG